MGVSVAIVGATGAVGQEMIKTLIDRNFPADEIRLLASHRSAGKKVEVRGEELEIQELTHESFEGIRIGLFSAGGSISKEFAPSAVKAGAVVVDNTSAFRMDENTPLVVPEVNPGAIAKHKGIIANPNCSTIQMVLVLKPLYDISRIKRIVVSTYQAVSGAGAKAILEMQEETRALLDGTTYERKIFPHQVAFNALPQIGQKNAFQENGYTDEEMKMVKETVKIFSDPNIRVTATTVRIPVVRGHSESVNVEFENKITVEEARKALAAFPGIVVQDDPKNQIYPLASECVGKYETFVGRLRQDLSCENALNMWIVSDNLLKGAALNAVQIAEKLI
ncbi:MAG: aspartate-semialdehyde dehydrogenase [Planctomycetota bacterium]|nr:aspartate-semialdehyde dehydrogenase [Planctomycetota bacterium]MDA1138405.1 aspartate-semialdehyde dehydrogenase [Planctomycetota bacterium]